MAILITLLITGYLGLVSGEEKAAWRLSLHGIAAYALIVVFIWKSAIILDAYRRKNKWTRQRILFVLLLVMLLAIVAMGLLWTVNGPLYVAGFSLVSLHIYLAIPTMLLMAWHSWRHKFIFRVKGSLDRRLFLGAATTAVLGAAFWRTAQWGQDLLEWPGAKRRFTGSYQRGSFTGTFPVVSWIADDPQPIDNSAWRLAIDGAVEKPLSISYEALLALPSVTREVVLDCTGGWYTRQLWQGVPLHDLFAQAELIDTTVSITVESVTGYTRRFPLAESHSMLLAHHVAGQPLTHGHGAPLRLVIPHKRGLEWVKWITAIHANTTSALWQPPLPLP